MPSASVLTLATLFCDQRGLPTPLSLFGSVDKSVKQLRSVISDVVLMLSEYKWPDQRLRKTWTSASGTDQGTLISIFGSGYFGLVKDTLWNETRKIPIRGPVTDQTWQTLQSLPNAGPEYQYWISGGKLYITPALPSGETLSAVYITKNVVEHPGTPSTYGDFITGDTDIFFFPNHVFLRCLEYKWKKVKGEAGWEDEYNETIALIARHVARDTAPNIAFDSCASGARPGILIPSGNWNV